MTRYAFWIIAGLVIALDQWTKHLVETYLPFGQSVPVLPPVLSFTHLHNPGVAFGQFSNGGPLLIVAAVGAAVGLILYRVRLLRELGRLPFQLTLGLALPLGGAVGNMIDRIRIGKVVDFLDLHWWPVFNVADTAITLGAAALIYYFTFQHPATLARVQQPTVAETGE